MTERTAQEVYDDMKRIHKSIRDTDDLVIRISRELHLSLSSLQIAHAGLSGTDPTAAAAAIGAVADDIDRISDQMRNAVAKTVEADRKHLMQDMEDLKEILGI
jgi:Na+/phosphate symporter